MMEMAMWLHEEDLIPRSQYETTLHNIFLWLLTRCVAGKTLARAFVVACRSKPTCECKTTKHKDDLLILRKSHLGQQLFSNW